MEPKIGPVVFTPDNEPYLGRELLFHFDQLICSLMEQNATMAAASHALKLSDHQKMACQVIPQAISLTLSIRELIRQGYLFGAHVMKRTLEERAAILYYIHLFPEEITVWNDGWDCGRNAKSKAPSLAKMLEAIGKKIGREPPIPGWKLTESRNSLIHGKPDSRFYNLIVTKEGGIGYASSKILNRPDLCDALCADILSQVVIVQCMMAAYFPKE